MLRVHRGLLGLAVVAAAPAAAQLNDLDEALRTTPITTQQLAENFHVLFGVGGNILVSIGENGVLIVDDQFPQMVPKYKATIGELGGGAINFAINTHWHFDHADGNQVLGPEGTWLVAHETSRQMMMKDNVINLVNARRDQPAYPETALPVLTYDDRMRFHFNGERIDLVHFGPAHTTGDTAVIFRGHRTVHMGDVYNNAGYPFIDADNGGSLAGQKVRELITVNGVRIVLEDGTWGLVRASSNKPELVVVVESPTSEANMRAIFAEIEAELGKQPEVGAYNQKI